VRLQIEDYSRQVQEGDVRIKSVSMAAKMAGDGVLLSDHEFRDHVPELSRY